MDENRREIGRDRRKADRRNVIQISQSANESLEVSGSALGITGRVVAKAKEIRLLAAVLLVLFMVAVTAGGLTALLTHANESRVFSEKFLHSFDEMNKTLEMQTCLNTLPTDERKQEYLNPNGFCRFLSKTK
jgi:hypothetical protein